MGGVGSYLEIVCGGREEVTTGAGVCMWGGACFLTLRGPSQDMDMLTLSHVNVKGFSVLKYVLVFGAVRLLLIQRRSSTGTRTCVPSP